MFEYTRAILQLFHSDKVSWLPSYIQNFILTDRPLIPDDISAQIMVTNTWIADSALHKNELTYAILSYCCV
jgi:hypothetical protein